ncbi:hypothetical protein E2C01_050752 [Portunus trituberculatus]|uniref:Uncharacterized protein n=1 Tax=Portunus trituberculatus TaxID=210409 RepID=A0A5B7GH70_PORTR|nr:hypothetical protein [Portunus trituberculatus]
MRAWRRVADETAWARAMTTGSRLRRMSGRCPSPSPTRPSPSNLAAPPPTLTPPPPPQHQSRPETLTPGRGEPTRHTVQGKVHTSISHQY